MGWTQSTNSNMGCTCICTWSYINCTIKCKVKGGFQLNTMWCRAGTGPIDWSHICRKCSGLKAFRDGSCLRFISSKIPSHLFRQQSREGLWRWTNGGPATPGAKMGQDLLHWYVPLSKCITKLKQSLGGSLWPTWSHHMSKFFSLIWLWNRPLTVS